MSHLLPFYLSQQSAVVFRDMEETLIKRWGAKDVGRHYNERKSNLGNNEKSYDACGPIMQPQRCPVTQQTLQLC